MTDCVLEEFEKWFAGTNPAALDFSNPKVVRDFAYQAWKDSALTPRSPPPAAFYYCRFVEAGLDAIEIKEYESWPKEDRKVSGYLPAYTNVAGRWPVTEEMVMGFCDTYTVSKHNPCGHVPNQAATEEALTAILSESMV